MVLFSRNTAMRQNTKKKKILKKLNLLKFTCPPATILLLQKLISISHFLDRLLFLAPQPPLIYAVQKLPKIFLFFLARISSLFRCRIIF